MSDRAARQFRTLYSVFPFINPDFGMDKDTPALQQLNRTIIGSVLFIDIVGYTKRSVQQQLALKEWFNRLLIGAIQNVAPSERILVDTGDGAAVAFLGDPEDALFTALSLRDAIDAADEEHAESMVRMGINLGPLKVVRDINGHTNIIGDGVNDAQRVMSFADPGHVMVSHSYYDMISRFSHDYNKLFVYEGQRQDKHVREHKVYRLGVIDGGDDMSERIRDMLQSRTVNSSAVPRMDTAAGTKKAGAMATPGKKKPVLIAGAAAAVIGVAAIAMLSEPKSGPPAAAPAASAPNTSAKSAAVAGATTAASAPTGDKSENASAAVAASTPTGAPAKTAEQASAPTIQKTAATRKDKAAAKPEAPPCRKILFLNKCADTPTNTPAPINGPG